MSDGPADLTGLVAIVTGGAGNLGKAVARRFITGGAHVVPVDLAMDRVRAKFAGIESAGGHLVHEPVNSTDPDSFGAAVQAVVERFGRLDDLTKTVGGFRTGPPVHELPLADWDQR